MPKRYPQWLDNSVAIDLRTLVERQENAFEKISALRKEEDALQRLLDDVRQDLKTAQTEFRGINFEITKILREHVPRFIQCGNMIIPDNNKIFSIEEKLSCKSSMKPPVTFNTGNVEWYTPPDIVHAVHQTLGHVDLDPASSSTANETIKAKKFFTAADDSLNRPWFGRIYLNPPYARGVVKKFVSKLISEFNTGHVKSAVILVNAQTDAKWFNSIAQACTGAIFTQGRIRFLQANGTLSKNTPTFGQCIFYLGYDVEKFFAAFAPFGYPVFFGKKII